MSTDLTVPGAADPHGVLQLAIWTETSLTLPADLSYEGWAEIGDVLARLGRSHQWWMGDWWRFGEHRYGERAAQALDSGWEFQTWVAAGWVAARIETLRRRSVLSWSHHREVAALEPDEQDRWLAAAEGGKWTRSELRSAVRRARVATNDPGLLPAGKYNVLLADPPWRYEFVEADNRAIENQYPTLATEDICNYVDEQGRRIADLAADDALLFLWATNPKLTEAMQVIEAWGFTYRTNLVWVKDRIGMGYWARQQHELLLVARRGEFPTPPEDSRPSSVIEAPRGMHSAKPLIVYDLIDRMYPSAKKLELFARSGRDDWASFGNQAA